MNKHLFSVDIVKVAGMLVMAGVLTACGKDEVKEAREGQECGMAFENYTDLEAGDMIECFEIEEIARTL